MFLRAKRIISDITERVNAGAVEIIEIIEKYEEELCLAKEEIDRQRRLLAAAVPQQTALTDVQRCELQHSVHISVCEKEEESDSSDSQFTVYPVSIASIRFEELTECQHTGTEDNLCSCHEAEESGGSGEAGDQMREDEEPKSTPGQAAANITMDNPEIQQEEEDKEMSSSCNIDDQCCQNIQAATEDHMMSSASSPSFKNLSIPLHCIQLMENSPAQQMKETREALNATEGRQLRSTHLLVATSQDSRDDQGGQQSHQNQYNCLVCEKGFSHRRSMERHMKSKHIKKKRQKFGGSGEAHCSFSQIDVDQMTEDEVPKSSPGQAAANMMMDNPEIQQEEEDKEEEEPSSSSNIDDKCSQNTQADAEEHTMSSTSSPSFKNLSIPLQRIQLMENSGVDCRPSSPAQQMKETREALNANEGRQLLSPHLLLAPSQDSRDDQGGQQSHQNQYYCLVCEKWFKYCRSMKRHMKSQHTKKKKRQKSGGSGEAHCSFSQIDVDQMTEDEEPKSSPGQAGANMMVDNPEIQQEEEELSSSSNIDDKCSKNTQADTEDHTMSPTASPSFTNLSLLSVTLHRVQLMGNSGGDCQPSSPAQQMKETREALNATEGRPLLSPHLLVAPSQDSRDKQADMMDNPEIQLEEEEEEEQMSSSSDMYIDDKCTQNTQADAEDHAMSSTQHTEEKPHQYQYYCHVCGKGFEYHINMKRHVKSNHAGETKQIQFYCHVCGKGFEYRQNVKRHVMSHHTGERPFCCKVCGKGFKRRTALRRHMRGKRAHP